MQLLNRSLRLDYAGYYDRLSGWKRKNIEFREGELDESLLYKYCGLWMNDQIYRLLMEIEKHLTDSGLYRREAKHHFLEAKKEMRRYNALLPSRHNLSKERFAEVMLNMEDLLKPSLDILCFSVSRICAVCIASCRSVTSCNGLLSRRARMRPQRFIAVKPGKGRNEL